MSSLMEVVEVPEGFKKPGINVMFMYVKSLGIMYSHMFSLLVPVTRMTRQGEFISGIFTL